METCPCGSGKPYSGCCEPYLSGKTNPPTAEALMRARYTAYAKHEITFIENTHSSEEERDALAIEETRKWSESSTWLGLTILKTSKGGPNDTEGSVEFIARYSQNGAKHEHRETSEFEKVNGKWFFKEGEVSEGTVVRDSAKVGRNEPCPCGSGKKYKQCHGK